MFSQISPLQNEYMFKKILVIITYAVLDVFMAGWACLNKNINLMFCILNIDMAPYPVYVPPPIPFPVLSNAFSNSTTLFPSTPQFHYFLVPPFPSPTPWSPQG
jgi:hypothetical protein